MPGGTRQEVLPSGWGRAGGVTRSAKPRPFGNPNRLTCRDSVIAGTTPVTAGYADATHRAIGQARDARERQNEDDLLSLGGEFGFSLASQHYLAGSTLLVITGAERDAIAELERVTELVSAPR
jgi:hypothetical protein